MDAAVARLAQAVKESGYKRTRVAADAHMDPTKLSKILNGKQPATVTEFCDIARAIHQDPGRFFTEGELVVALASLNAIHEVSRDVATASNRLAALIATMIPPAPVELHPSLVRKPRDRSSQPVRAAANPNAELIVDRETVRKTIPRQAWNRGARMIARVVGDSMDGGEHPLRNGDLAYLKPTRSHRNVVNRIALVRRDDGLYLKTFEMSGHTIRLVSTNASANPLVIELDARAENMQVYGYVVDSGR